LDAARAEDKRAIAEAKAVEEAHARREAVARIVGRRKYRRILCALASATAGLLALAAIGYDLNSRRQAALAARAQLADEKRAAEWAGTEADRQRDAAEQERTVAIAVRRRLEVVEYGRVVQLAHHERRAGNFAEARALLDRTKPELRGWEWYYVNHFDGGSPLALKGHPRGVNCAAFSPDGSRVVTGGDDRAARVWDASTGAEVTALVGGGWTCSAAFSPDGTRVVTGGDDGTARVWDASTGAELLILEGHARDGLTPYLHAVAFSPDGARVVTGGDDGTARVWDANTGAEVLTLRCMSGVYSVSFSPDGSRILSAEENVVVKVWDNRVLRQLAPPPRPK
jgi:hypothetical protein